MARPSRYSPEVRERAIRLVQEHGPEYPSQWAAIGSIASKFGCTAETCASGSARPSVTGASAPGSRRTSGSAWGARARESRS